MHSERHVRIYAGGTKQQMSDFKDLRVVDNFYQTSLFPAFPVLCRKQRILCVHAGGEKLLQYRTESDQTQEMRHQLPGG